MTVAAQKDDFASSPLCNIASHVTAMAQLSPGRPALIVPKSFDGDRYTWTQLSFGELDARSDAIAIGLEKIGITRGVRTVLMVPPSLEFFPLVFALFKVGAVLVLIDPGIGRKALLKCLDEVEGEVFIGVPAAHVARLLFPKPFRKVRALVTVGGPKLWGGHSLAQVEAMGAGSRYTMAPTSPAETAAILFTSGSTGIPKGAVYTHGIFDAQVRIIGRLYGIQPGEIDLPTFAPFALFDPALGMTAVLPQMDFRNPAKASPLKIVRALEDHGATNMFGSPALLDQLGRYAAANGTKLPTLKRVLSAGAPVRVDILERMKAMLPAGAQVFTPFGATESLPVASIGSEEVLGDTRHGTAEGRGVCVGRPVDEALVRIIRITDEPIESWSDALLAPNGEVGEITVRGPMVTHAYFARPEQTRAAKIRDGEQVVHRMGDLGYLDEQGRLWMCGRKTQRVVTSGGSLFTAQVEEIFNQHAAVKRSALVGVGERPNQTPVLVVEREPSSTESDETLRAALLELGARFTHTKPVQKILFYGQPLPVDIRHNAKIEREKLAAWARSRA